MVCCYVCSDCNADADVCLTLGLPQRHALSLWTSPDASQAGVGSDQEMSA